MGVDFVRVDFVGLTHSGKLLNYQSGHFFAEGALFA